MAHAEMARRCRPPAPEGHLPRGLAEGDQVPLAIGHRGLAPQDVQVPVVRTDFIPGILRTVPLIDDFLDSILVRIDPESHRTLFRSVGRVALHVNAHCTILSQREESGPTLDNSISVRI